MQHGVKDKCWRLENEAIRERHHLDLGANITRTSRLPRQTLPHRGNPQHLGDSYSSEITLPFLRFHHQTALLPTVGTTTEFSHARLVFIVLPGVETHAVAEPHRSHEALLGDVDYVWGLQPVRKVDAQLARKGIQRAQGSCHPCHTKGHTSTHIQYELRNIVCYINTSGLSSPHCGA